MRRSQTSYAISLKVPAIMLEQDSPLRARLPVLILLGIITLVSIIDWIHGLGAWMMVPDKVMSAWADLRDGNSDGETWTILATTLTAEFLHGSGAHLIGNLLFLWIFGVVVFELCGWRWMVAVFLITGIGGSIGQIMLETDSMIPTLGASGGLMGLEGFYFGLAFQRERPPASVWPIARPISAEQLALAGVIGVTLDFAGAIDGGGGIAYGAHIGGFVSGILLSLIADRFVRPV